MSVLTANLPIIADMSGNPYDPRYQQPNPMQPQAPPMYPPSGSPASTSNSFTDYLAFHKFITPRVTSVIYVVGIAVIIIFALISFAQGNTWFGIAVLVVGNIYWRITCEAIIVIFRIHGHLQSIDRRMGGSA